MKYVAFTGYCVSVAAADCAHAAVKAWACDGGYDVAGLAEVAGGYAAGCAV